MLVNESIRSRKQYESNHRGFKCPTYQKPWTCRVMVGEDELLTDFAPMDNVFLYRDEFENQVVAYLFGLSFL